MPQPNPQLLARLRAAFAIEAQEHLQSISSGLVEIESSPGAADAALERVFRAAHSLKGAARAVGEGAVATGVTAGAFAAACAWASRTSAADGKIPRWTAAAFCWTLSTARLEKNGAMRALLPGIACSIAVEAAWRWPPSASTKARTRSAAGSRLSCTMSSPV